MLIIFLVSILLEALGWLVSLICINILLHLLHMMSKVTGFYIVIFDLLHMQMAESHVLFVIESTDFGSGVPTFL